MSSFGALDPISGDAQEILFWESRGMEGVDPGRRPFPEAQGMLEVTQLSAAVAEISGEYLAIVQNTLS